MIRLDNVSKVYGRRARAVTALRDVSLEAGPGVWGVVGPNGAGKTTLLGLILGFLHPTSGSIAIDGATPRRHVRRHGAAYLPERFSLPPEWPVRGALRSLARLEGHDAAHARQRADDALDRMGLAPFADRAVGTLSRGLNQRLGLAQALLAPRDLVVLDEPTEGLDPLWRVRLRELVLELAGDGRTVLLASHELAEVERLADRVIVLDDGRVTDIMATRQPADGPRRYRLLVEAGTARIQAAFPDAAVAEAEATGEAATPGVAAGGAGPPRAREVVVTVADTAELSHRIAALLDAGAVIHAVTPADRDLEARVRERLEGA